MPSLLSRVSVSLRGHATPNWLTIVLALVTAGASIWAALIQSDNNSPASNPTIEITSPSDLNSAPEADGPITLTGHASDLAPGQTIWPFDRKEGNSEVYAHSGPCPVDTNGDFTCPPFDIGQDLVDDNARFSLYASVVNDEDVRDLVLKEAERSQGVFKPVDVTKPRGFVSTSVQVIRK